MARNVFWIIPLLLSSVTTGAWGQKSDTPSAKEYQDAHWIWSPAHQDIQDVPGGTCYFRRTFRMENPVEGQVQITCDDEYELFVNGRKVGEGRNWKKLDVFDVTGHLVRGKNVVAVKATNRANGSAALVARVVVKEQGSPHIAHLTDTNWKTSLKTFRDWYLRAFDDSEWVPSHSFGKLGETLPWGNEVQVAGEGVRFRTPPKFVVEWVINPEKTGSLIAMTFNEYGQIIASRERGPLLLISDKDGDTVHESLEVYCDRVTNCQGLLVLDPSRPVEGDAVSPSEKGASSVLAMADGPDGAALYRLTDTNVDGKVDDIKTLVRLKGRMQEYGPHGLAQGPDGMIYMVVGNHAQPRDDISPQSPYPKAYEGDLVQPRYQDPGGHAMGVPAPGGTILRTDADGRSVEMVAGGLRNAYDLAFNRQGDLFTYDSDMEWDKGTPWYRPTRINHVIPGAELGWRSGWAKWPAYFHDSLPATVSLGPGSPTGVTFYNHLMYPVRFHNAMFACDWSRGQIHVIRLRSSGGTYTAETDLFVEGRPLNATDIEVGPDGWLYFCTGGRGTAGGIYRVIWEGRVPEEVTELGQGLDRALDFPQPSSAWARRAIRDVQSKMGGRWKSSLTTIATGTRFRPSRRQRALALLARFGPVPSPQLLVELSSDRSATMRAQAATLMGLAASAELTDRLIGLLDDDDAGVRRKACEALVRRGNPIPIQRLAQLVSDSDRFVAFAARRALERVPPEEYRDDILSTHRTRLFIQGATALLAKHPDADTAQVILERCHEILRGEIRDPKYPAGFVSDENFIDLLRVMQLAFLRGDLPPTRMATLGSDLAKEYPSTDVTMNREIVRILVFLQEPSVVPRMIRELEGDVPDTEKLHVATHLSLHKRGWTTDHKMQLLKYYEHARSLSGGHSLSRYIEGATREFCSHLTDEEREAVLARGAQWPGAALATLASFPNSSDPSILGRIRALDEEVAAMEGPAVKDLRVGIVAVLARTRDPQAMAYLRQRYQEEPERRSVIAMGLAQDPNGENWTILVQSLGSLEGVAAQEVLAQLSTVDRQPDEPEMFRQAILCGLRGKEQASKQVVVLLEKWTGEKISRAGQPWHRAMSAWQNWFVKTYPNESKPELPQDSRRSKWTQEELLSYLQSPEGSQGNPVQGRLVFRKAQCVKCHRFGNHGEAIGPDLTGVSQRLQKKELLESILFPSHVIADQYASRIVVTTVGRSYLGMVAPLGRDSIAVLQPSGEKVEIATKLIEEIIPSQKSAMPDGLLNPLTLKDIANLFEYLSQPQSARITRRPARNF